MRRIFVGAAILVAFAALPATPQTLSWSQWKAAGTQPSPRQDGTIAYDPAGNQLFLFGGQDASSSKNDLWSWSVDRAQWTQIQPSGALPPARTYHSLVYDSKARRLIVFGGIGSSNFSDVWAFDIASASWSQLSPSGAGPSPRHGHSAIYDSARNRMVISHGFTDAGRFNDTWAFDLAANSWSNLTPSGSKPLNRCLHHAAYDAAGSRMFLYGGCSSGYGPCPQGDLWSFDLNTNQWTDRTPGSVPPARMLYAMAFDATRGRLVVFGGDGASGLFNDTWEFDPTAGTWQKTTLSGASPNARQRHETAWVNGIGMVFFGGATDSGLSNELWALAPVAALPSISPGGVIDAFSGIGNAVAPGEDISIYGVGLGPSTGAAQSFDSKTLTLPVAASGVSVAWNGIQSPLYYVSAGQINAQVPYELAGLTEASLVVTVNSQASAPVKVPIAPVHPSLFPRVFNADGSVNSPANPAARGSVVFFYATGQGVTSPASKTGAAAIDSYPNPAADVTVTLGGSAAQVLFKGQAPYTAGVMQINAKLAPDAPGGDAIPLVLTVGGVAAQSGITVAIQR